MEPVSCKVSGQPSAGPTSVVRNPHCTCFKSIADVPESCRIEQAADAVPREKKNDLNPTPKSAFWKTAAICPGDAQFYITRATEILIFQLGQMERVAGYDR